MPRGVAIPLRISFSSNGLEVLYNSFTTPVGFPVSSRELYDRFAKGHSMRDIRVSLLLPIVFFGGIVQTPMATAQSAGTFTATGNMTIPRYGHTATLLPNSKVLIAGGNYDVYAGLPVSSAELYDPSTGAFTATGNLRIARSSHTATLLPGGKVLIAGGVDADGEAVLGAELYDPSTGTFTATGSMSFLHTCATLLNNGKVLMSLPTSNNAEVYDPSSGVFAAAPVYVGVTGGFSTTSATWLADGRVLIAAGTPSPGPSNDPDPISAQLYDPVTGVFRLTGAMVHPAAFSGRSATLLTNGKVLFAGGLVIGNSQPYAGYPDGELYDPSAGNFTASGNLIQPRSEHTATLLPDGAVLITGGISADAQSAAFYDYHQSAELYDARRGTFNFAGNMTMVRVNHVATLLKDGTVLITGGTQNYGQTSFPVTLASAELYKPSAPVPAPVLFSLSGDGQGQGAIWDGITGQVASPANPAVAGEVLSMYTRSLAAEGVIPPQVAVGDRPSDVLYFGAAPSYPGYYQVNFRMPGGAAPGDAVPVSLTYLGRSSNAVTIGAQ